MIVLSVHAETELFLPEKECFQVNIWPQAFSFVCIWDGLERFSIYVFPVMLFLVKYIEEVQNLKFFTLRIYLSFSVTSFKCNSSKTWQCDFILK